MRVEWNQPAQGPPATIEWDAPPISGEASPQLIDSMIQAESSGDPRAVSPGGAQGLMQLMPGTAREMGVKDPFDPEQNRAGGTRYINKMLRKYDGDQELALMAYNWGPGNVDKWLKGGRRGQVPKETQAYVAKLLPTTKAAAAPEIGGTVEWDAPLIPDIVKPQLTLDEPQGATGAAASQFMQGLAGTGAGLLEAPALANQKMLRSVQKDFDAIDAGTWKPNRNPVLRDYAGADPAGRSRMRAGLEAEIKPLEETTFGGAAETLRRAAAEAFPVDPKRAENLATQFGGAAGSMAGFLLGGAAGRALGLPGGATAATVGAASGASEGFHDAIRSGADWDTAFKSAKIGGLVGTSEGLPIAQAFNRFDKATGGTLKKAIIEGIKGGIEEGTQELGQQIAAALTAQHLYDPDRKTFAGAGTGAGIGFTLGSLVSFVAAAAGGRRLDTGKLAEAVDRAMVQGQGTAQLQAQPPAFEPQTFQPAPAAPAAAPSPTMAPPPAPPATQEAPLAPPQAAGEPITVRQGVPLARQSHSDLGQFVRVMGGIRDTGGDLAAMEWNRPGIINNANGLGLDDMATAAHQQGYIAAPDTDELLARLQDASFGERAQAPEMAGEIEWDAAGPTTFEAAEPTGPDPFEGMDPFDIMGWRSDLQKIVDQIEQKGPTPDLLRKQEELQRNIQSAGAQNMPERAPGLQFPAPSPTAAVQADRLPAPPTQFRAKVEPTEQGLQTVIPGAERITEAEQAQRATDAPLQAAAPQAAADEGLFDVAGRGQLDLVQQAQAAPELPGKVVWHGSPHTFEQFSTEQIGTGEGAQAYGHGLYFTDTKAVAEYYRDASDKTTREVGPFAKAQAKKALGGDLDIANPAAFRALVGMAVDKDVSPEDAGRRLYARYPGLRDLSGGERATGLHPVLEKLITDIRQEAEQHRGRVYKAELAPKEDEYLLWDRPLSEQSPKVRQAVEAAIKEHGISEQDYTMPIRYPDGRQERISEGSTIYRAFVRKFGGRDDFQIGNSAVASDALHAAGIRGIKYLDQMSRDPAGGAAADTAKRLVNATGSVEAAITEAQSRIEQAKASPQGNIEASNLPEALKYLQEKGDPRSFNYVVFSDEDVNIVEMHSGINLKTMQEHWGKQADRVLDNLAEAKWLPFRMLGGYPLRDPWMSTLGKEGRRKFRALRGRRLGQAGKFEEISDRLSRVLDKAGNEKMIVFDYLTTAGADPATITSPAVRSAATRAKSAIRKIGEVMVKRGMIQRESFEAHLDAYLPRLYLKHLLDRPGEGFARGLTIGEQGYTKQRIDDLPQEYREFLGEIQDPGLLVRKAIQTPVWDMAMQDLLADISHNPDWVLPESMVEWKPPGLDRGKTVTPFWLYSEADAVRRRARAMDNPQARQRAMNVAEDMTAAADAGVGLFRKQYGELPDGFERIPDSPRYGELRGLAVRKQIHQDIVGAHDMTLGTKTWVNKLGQGSRTATAWWKLFKVPLNPPSVARNFVSNMVLQHTAGDVSNPPLRMVQALKEMRTGGRHTGIAKKYGVPFSTWRQAELLDIQKDVLSLKADASDRMGWALKVGAKLAGKAESVADFYQFLETWGKVAVIIDQKAKGVTDEEAVAKAQEALFDYSAIPLWLSQLRRHPLGTPFATFYYKALPAMIRAAARHPVRMSMYYAIPYILGDALLADLKDVDEEDVERLREALPEWLRDSPHSYVYPVKDASGRWAFVDYGYFLPWGAHVDTAVAAKKMLTGDTEKGFTELTREFGIFGGPVPQIIAAIQSGKDTFTQRSIWKESDPPVIKTRKMMEFVWRMGAPTWLTDIGVTGHMYRAATGTPNYYGDPPLSVPQAAGRAVGVNIYPVDPPLSRTRNLRRMRREIQDMKRNRTSTMKDRRLTKEQRKAVSAQFKETIQARQQQFRDYQKRSKVPEALR